MKITLDIVITEDLYETFVFFRPGSPEDAFRATWALWEKPEVAREIAVAVAAAVDAMQGEADETMREFFRIGCERLEEERRLDEAARRAEWS